MDCGHFVSVGLASAFSQRDQFAAGGDQQAAVGHQEVSAAGARWTRSMAFFSSAVCCVEDIDLFPRRPEDAAAGQDAAAVAQLLGACRARRAGAGRDRWSFRPIQ